jgi:hypothetical protein
VTRKTRSYTPEEVAAALAVLAACDGNVSRAAAETGVPRITLLGWAKRQQEARPVAAGGEGVEQYSTAKKRGPAPAVPVSAAAIEQARGTLADKLEALAHQLADALPAKIAAAPLSQCAVSLGIAIEKMRLLREQSTGNQGVLRVEFEELRKLDPEELLRRYRQALAGTN